MDLFPLWNSLRIAALASVIVFFLGIFAAFYVAKLNRVLKGVIDVILTLPLVLPPTVIGYAGVPAALIRSASYRRSTSKIEATQHGSKGGNVHWPDTEHEIIT